MNPWDRIPAPQNKQDVNSVLYSGSVLPDGVTIEWVRFFDSSVGISIFFDEYKGEPVTLPSFKVLDLVFRLRVASKKSCIQIVLLDGEMEDLFYRLCLDIAESISAGTTQNVLYRIIARLEEWKRLLSTAQRKLSKNQQKGLIGELTFLQEILINELDPMNAAKAWTGPAGSPRDFTIGFTFFEVKTNRGAQDHSVIISSENQLATTESEELILCVLGVSEDPANGFTLDEVVEETRQSFSQDPAALAYFNELLSASGYSDVIDYSDTKWSRERFHYYYVSEGFPRIVPSSIPIEISEVNYRLELSHLDEFLADEETVKSKIRC